MEMVYYGIKTLNELNTIEVANKKRRESKEREERRQQEEVAQQHKLLVTGPFYLTELDLSFNLMPNNPLQVILGFNNKTL